MISFVKLLCTDLCRALGKLFGFIGLVIVGGVALTIIGSPGLFIAIILPRYILEWDTSERSWRMVGVAFAGLAAKPVFWGSLICIFGCVPCRYLRNRWDDSQRITQAPAEPLKAVVVVPAAPRADIDMAVGRVLL